MLNRKLMMLTIVLVSLIAISAVSANELNATDEVVGQKIAIDDNTINGVDIDDKLEISEENNLSSTINVTGNTFEDIQNAVDRANEGDKISLSGNYEGSGSMVKIAKTVEIEGNGAILDAKGLSKMFEITGNYVKVNNITFINGNGPSSGAIDWWTGNYDGPKDSYGLLTNCRFINNTVENLGGAVYLFDNHITVSDCYFEKNSADYGGAIHVYGSDCAIQDCVFKLNCAKKGGAIYVEGSNCAIQDSSFMTNYKKDEMTQSDIYGVTATNCVFSFDSTIFHYEYSTTPIEYNITDITPSGNIISGNTFADIQNAINNAEPGDVIELSGTYQGSGSKIVVNKAVTLFGVGNTVLDAKGLSSILSISSPNVSVYGISFINGDNAKFDSANSNDNANKAGAIYSTSDGIFIKDCIFRDNQGYLSGAVLWSGDNCIIKDSTFINNVAMADKGMWSNGKYYEGVVNTEYYKKCAGAIVWKGDNGILDNSLFDGNSGYTNDYYWEGTGGKVIIAPLKLDTHISAVYDVESKELVATLTNDNAKALVSANIVINLSGAKYALKTNSKGQVRVSAADLAPGLYSADISYKGNSKYNPSNAIAVVNTRYDTCISGVYDEGAEELIVSLTNASNGKSFVSANVLVSVNCVDYALKTDSKGQVRVSVADLAPGLYSADISYKGNSKYNPSNAVVVVNNRLDTCISGVYDSVVKELIVSLTNGEGKALTSANVVVTLDGVVHALKTNSKGQAIIFTDGLTLGTYVASISYGGNAKYNPSNNTVKVIVKTDTCISAPDIHVQYNDGSELVATLINNFTGNVIGGANIVINLNDVKYALKTNSKGQVKVSSDGLTPGTYVASISYAGNSKYNPSSVAAKVIVKADTQISASKVLADYNDGSELVATLINKYTGKSISGAVVVIMINGVKHSLKTDSNGQVRLSTDGLTPGSYVASISYAGNFKYNPSSKNVKVVVDKADTVLSARNAFVVYGGEDGKLVATLTSSAGKPLKFANVLVTLDGVDYALKTNSEGKISVSTLGLLPGTYSASISYAGNAKYNPSSKKVKVVVDKADVVLSADDIHVLYPVDSVDLVATLTSAVTGRPLNGANVVVSFDGVDYALKTNSKGQVVLSTGDLSIKVHTATISYAGNSKFNPATATANIIVSADTIITASDVSVAYRDESGELIAKLSNAVTDKGVGGVTLIITVDGVDYSAKTDSNGQIKFSTSVLAPGTHSARISFGGTTRYKPSSTSVKIVVAKADVALSANDVSVAYNDGGELLIGLTNAYGQALNGANLVVSIDGDSFTVKTNASGQAAVSCDGLAPGNHAASISYAGNSKYNSASATTNIAVSKAPTAIFALCGEGMLLASLTNGVSGKTINGAKIIVDINGVKYSESTNSEGQVGFSISGLAPGKYSATVSYNGNAKYDPSSTTVNMVIK